MTPCQNCEEINKEWFPCIRCVLIQIRNRLEVISDELTEIRKQKEIPQTSTLSPIRPTSKPKIIPLFSKPKKKPTLIQKQPLKYPPTKTRHPTNIHEALKKVKKR